ncbi:hypothetical protein Ddc_23474 [Ditylenchus destructor]|nr:hypothetical protein Ddc_23474 [Ditylenchus destructor]
MREPRDPRWRRASAQRGDARLGDLGVFGGLHAADATAPMQKPSTITGNATFEHPFQRHAQESVAAVVDDVLVNLGIATTHRRGLGLGGSDHGRGGGRHCPDAAATADGPGRHRRSRSSGASCS